MHLNYGVGPQLLEAMQTRGFLLQCGPILFKLFRCEEFPRAVPWKQLCCYFLTLPVCQDNPGQTSFPKILSIRDLELGEPQGKLPIRVMNIQSCKHG